MPCVLCRRYEATTTVEHLRICARCFIKLPRCREHRKPALYEIVGGELAGQRYCRECCPVPIDEEEI